MMSKGLDHVRLKSPFNLNAAKGNKQIFFFKYPLIFINYQKRSVLFLSIKEKNKATDSQVQVKLYLVFNVCVTMTNN